MTHKSFFIKTVISVLAILLVFCLTTVIVDPFFHYHAPLDALGYPINAQRYQNDGILRNFDYDSIIIGTSMTENFYASQWDELFDAKTVKVSLSGSYFKESTEQLRRTFNVKKDIKYVVRSLDFYSIVADKDVVSEFDYPTYLYDDNIFNDVKYLLNKSVFFNNTITVFKHTSKGNKTTTFDDAYSWYNNFNYGKQFVLERYVRPEKAQVISTSFNDMKQIIKENIEENIISLALEHPETDFYLFYPPYSIVAWDRWNQNGEIEQSIEIMRYVSQLLMDYDNIHLFSFNDQFDVICDLNNYKDLEHYGDWINKEIFDNMKTGKGLITQENIDAHFDSLKDFYTKYDYDAIFTS